MPQQQAQGWPLPPNPHSWASPDGNESAGSFAADVVIGTEKLLLQEGHHAAAQSLSGILHQAGRQCVQEEFLDLFLLPLQLPHQQRDQAVIDNALGPCRTGKDTLPILGGIQRCGESYRACRGLDQTTCKCPHCQAEGLSNQQEAVGDKEEWGI